MPCRCNAKNFQALWQLWSALSLSFSSVRSTLPIIMSTVHQVHTEPEVGYLFEDLMTASYLSNAWPSNPSLHDKVLIINFKQSAAALIYCQWTGGPNITGRYLSPDLLIMALLKNLVKGDRIFRDCILCGCRLPGDAEEPMAFFAMSRTVGTYVDPGNFYGVKIFYWGHKLTTQMISMTHRVLLSIMECNWQIFSVMTYCYTSFS